MEAVRAVRPSVLHLFLFDFVWLASFAFSVQKITHLIRRLGMEWAAAAAAAAVRYQENAARVTFEC